MAMTGSLALAADGPVIEACLALGVLPRGDARGAVQCSDTSKPMLNTGVGETPCLGQAGLGPTCPTWLTGPTCPLCTEASIVVNHTLVQAERELCRY